jgi:hypothetical protein
MTMIEFALPDQPKVCTVKITRFVRRQAGYLEGFPFNLPRKRDDRVAASCLFLARNGLACAFRRGPLLKVDRKSSADGQNGAFDPYETWRRRDSITLSRRRGRKEEFQD